MPEWTVQVDALYAKPGEAGAGSQVAYHTFTVRFDCSCSHRRDYQGESQDVDIAQFGSSVTNVRVTKSFSSPLGFGEAMLAPDPDRFNAVETEVSIRRANCPEGQGIIVWIRAAGSFNTNEHSPPFLWENYGAKGAWHICCCCDPFSGKSTYAVSNHRKPEGGGSGGLTVRIVAAENTSCDEKPQPREYLLQPE
jgi:hypothetical protein